MLAVSVVLINRVAFLISAVYIGGVPETRHEIPKPGNAVIKEAGNITLGEPNKNNSNSHQFMLLKMFRYIVSLVIIFMQNEKSLAYQEIVYSYCIGANSHINFLTIALCPQ